MSESADGRAVSNGGETPDKQTDQELHIETISQMSLTNSALYDSGRNMIVEAVPVLREFCKFMIGISAGSIPAYLALLNFIMPNHKQATDMGLIFLLPPILFVISTAVFAGGYMPRGSPICLERLDDLRLIHVKFVRSKKSLAICGFTLYCCALIISILCLYVVLQKWT